MNSGERMMTSGHRKLFQLAMNAKTATVARAGRISGTTIWRKIRRWLAPSMVAASSSSRGTDSMACLRRKTPNAEAMLGASRPA